LNIWNPINYVSDIKHKKNINTINYGLKDILKLRPVTYNWKINDNGTRIGFIAQEVEKVIPEIITKDSLGENYSMKYSELIPVLTKGIQEQQVIIDSLRQKVELLIASKTIKEEGNFGKQYEPFNQLPILFQNRPNPFNGSTFIEYFLPKHTQSAFIRVIDNTGKLIKAFAINEIGYGQIQLDCRELASGTYHYSLLFNEQLVDTKTMILTDRN
jgi:hypothetical protein